MKIKEKYMYRKGSAALIINNKNQFLLVNLNSFKERYFSIPGGGQEKDETLFETIYRELNEELNIKKEDLELVGESKKALITEYLTPKISDGVEYNGSEKYYFGFKYIGDGNVKANENEVRSCK
ncbi:MAG: NUDIX domain-containing protein [Cyanobium sp. MAG06]|nr:NUDIX domain-containing protein [Cyanobium sp. MAG06]